MNSGFQNLSAMEYPGRILIIGRAGGQGEPVVIYAITGRSPSSQARRLEWKEGGVWVRPTDEKTIREGIHTFDLGHYRSSEGKLTQVVGSFKDGAGMWSMTAGATRE